MAKGDDSRARNRIDEQQQLAQSYLAGLQSSLANQYGNMGSFYSGQPVGPSASDMFGFGSTVPHFSWTGQPYFSGNGTDAPTTMGGSYGVGPSGNVAEEIKQYLSSLGPASSQTLESALPELQRRYPGLRPDSSGGPLDELVVPGVGLVDFITNAEGAGPKSWSAQTGGGGGFGGFGGGIPGLTLQSYGDIMGGYQGLLGDYDKLYNKMPGIWGGFLGSASNMAETGGLSEEDKANLRARAISPIRAVYENSLRNVDRTRALQGGYSPGYTTAMGRFNREMGQGVSDATTNAEAAIAEMVQKGKLGGLSAWGSGLGGYSSSLLGALGGKGGALGGMTGLYSATPGMATTFGNQALAASGQQLDAARIQAELGLGLIKGQVEAGKLPGKFQSAMGNIGSAVDLGGTIADIAYPWFKGKPSMGMGVPVNPGTNYGYYAGSPGYVDPNSMFEGFSSGAGVGPTSGAGMAGPYTDYAAALAESNMPSPTMLGGDFTFGGKTMSPYDMFKPYGPSTPVNANYNLGGAGVTATDTAPRSGLPSSFYYHF